jgi:hypothetical protein
MREKRYAYRILVGQPDGKRPLGRQRRRWVNNVRMNIILYSSILLHSLNNYLFLCPSMCNVVSYYFALYLFQNMFVPHAAIYRCSKNKQLFGMDLGEIGWYGVD